MKQVTVKSLGAAALGAAFAVTAAGSASAAAGVGDVLQTLPAESALSSLPLDQVGALAADQTLSQTAPADKTLSGDVVGEATGLLGQVPTDPNALTNDPVGALLGGLPLEGIKI
jgi:hypothetical protein